MTDQKLTLGQAIDKIVEALQSIDEAARPTVLSTVCAHLNIPSAATVTVKPSFPQTLPATVQEIPEQVLQAAPRTSGGTVDIRSIKEQKRPQTASQMACIVAYYLQELVASAERKTSISVADLDKYFKQAGYKLPKHIQQLLVDAKQSGYFETAGKGEYKLTAVGYNLVVHNLPKSAGV